MSPPDHWFEPVADHLGAAYLRYSFTKGTAQEVGFLVGALGLARATACSTWAAARGATPTRSPSGASRCSASTSARRSSTWPPPAPRRAPRSVRADARALAFDAEFDAAVSLCQGAFGLTGGPGAPLDADAGVLAGIARALRPGGTVAVSAFSAYFQVRWLEDVDTFDAEAGVNHERTEVKDEAGTDAPADLWTTCYTPRELRLLARAAGLEPRHVWSVTPGAYARTPPRSTRTSSCWWPSAPADAGTDGRNGGAERADGLTRARPPTPTPRRRCRRAREDPVERSVARRADGAEVDVGLVDQVVLVRPTPVLPGARPQAGPGRAVGRHRRPGDQHPVAPGDRAVHVDELDAVAGLGLDRAVGLDGGAVDPLHRTPSAASPPASAATSPASQATLPFAVAPDLGQHPDRRQALGHAGLGHVERRPRQAVGRRPQVPAAVLAHGRQQEAVGRAGDPGADHRPDARARGSRATSRRRARASSATRPSTTPVTSDASPEPTDGHRRRDGARPARPARQRRRLGHRSVPERQARMPVLAVAGWSRVTATAVHPPLPDATATGIMMPSGVASGRLGWPPGPPRASRRPGRAGRGWRG